MASFNTNPLQDQPVDLSTLIQQTIDDYNKSVTTQQNPNQPQQPQTQPLAINVDGQSHTFNSAEDATRFFSQRDERIKAQTQAAISEAQAQAAAIAAQSQQQQQPEKKPVIDKRQYADYLVEDPAQATMYALSGALGVQDAGQLLKGMVGEILTLRQEMVAETFKARHPEYQITQENADALTNILQQNQLGFTSQNLELAYSHGLRNGIIKVEEEQKQEQAQAQANPYRMSQNWQTAPPPQPRQATSPQNFGGAQPIANLAALDELPTDQIQGLIEKLSRMQ